MRSRLVLLVVPILLGLAPSAWAEPPVVHNPAEPPEGRAELQMQPRWSVGGEDSDLLLGRIVALTVDDEGRCYLLDNQLSEVQVISPEGEWLRAIGREGEAPGEFRNPQDIFLMNDGTVAVVQTMPPKIALLSPDGTPIDDHRLPDPGDGFRMLNRGEVASDRVVLVSSAFLMEGEKMGQQTLLYAVDDAGNEVAQYQEAMGGVDFANYSVGEEQLSNFAGFWAVDAQDRVVVAPHFSDYRLLVYAPDGSLVRTIEREHTARPRSKQEKERVSSRFRMNINGRDIAVIPQDVNRTIWDVHALDDGRLWVFLHDEVEDPEAGRVGRIDEFDAEGNYVRQWILKGPVDMRTDRLIFEGEKAYVVHDARAADGEEEAAEAAFVRVAGYDLEPGAGHGR